MNGAGIIICVLRDITIRKLEKHSFAGDTESIFVELNFRKSKWLLNGIYEPPFQPAQYFINSSRKALVACSDYENDLLVCDQYEAPIIDNKPTCYKYSNNNNKFFLTKTNTIFTGFLAFHKFAIKKILKVKI